MGFRPVVSSFRLGRTSQPTEEAGLEDRPVLAEQHDMLARRCRHMLYAAGSFASAEVWWLIGPRGGGKAVGGGWPRLPLRPDKLTSFTRADRVCEIG